MDNQPKYAVKMNGRIISPISQSRQIAEHFILSLPDNHRMLAEVVPIVEGNKELLLG